MGNPLLYPRGTHPSVPAYMSHDGDCVSEIGMSTWMKELEANQPKKIAYVRVLNDVVRRIVVPVWLSYYKKVIRVYADIVTGTLYTEEGKCLSSDQVEVIKWGKSLGVDAKREKKEQDAKEIRKIQRDWASGRLGK